MKNIALYILIATWLCSCTKDVSLQIAQEYEAEAKRYENSMHENNRKFSKQRYLWAAERYEEVGIYNDFSYNSQAATCYKKAGNIEKAKEQCIKALEYLQPLPLTYYGGSRYEALAFCNDIIGNTEEAAKAYANICLSDDTSWTYNTDRKNKQTQNCKKAIELNTKLNNINKTDEINTHIAKLYFKNVDNLSGGDRYASDAILSCETISSKSNANKCYTVGIDILKPKCDKNNKYNAQICSVVGKLYYEKKDIKNAFHYLNIAYENNYKSNLKEYKELLKQKCNAKDYNNCHRLAWIYEHEYPANHKEAISLYAKSCNANYYLSCNNLGVLHQDSNAFKLIDNKKSFELYTKACKGGEMIACSNIGGMYEQGKAVARNYNTAKSYYKKACNGGYEKACKFYNNLEANVVNIDEASFGTSLK